MTDNPSPSPPQNHVEPPDRSLNECNKHLVSETTFDAGTHISPQEYRISTDTRTCIKRIRQTYGRVGFRNDKIMELYGGLVLWHLLNIPNG